MLLSIGSKLPSFEAVGVVGTNPENAFIKVNNSHFAKKWGMIFFWPMDFTFVCPTEIIGFGKLYPEFKKNNCEVLGVSTDSQYVHLAWKQSNKGLGEVPFPFVADVTRELSSRLGVLDHNKGIANRGTVIVDPEGTIRYISVQDLSVGRNPAEILRILQALQTDQLCGCDWQPGQSHL